jgi:hypothetical protein
VFAPIVYAAEGLTDVSLMLGMFTLSLGDRGAAAPQHMAWPLQRVGRVAVDCLLPARAAIDVCRALLWPEPRCRRAFDDQHLQAPGHRRDRPPTRSRIFGHSVI